MKEISAERRALLAAALSLLIILLWSVIYKPAQPKRPSPTPQTGQPAQPAASAPTPGAIAPKQEPRTTPARATSAAASPQSASQEETVVVENGLYRVEFSNRGAVVRSWQLNRYKDDAKPPRTLDLVHRDAAQQEGAWPLSLALADGNLETTVNSALFQWTLGGQPACSTEKPQPPRLVATSDGFTSLSAPADICFSWSDGRIAVNKRVEFDSSYLVHIETSVTLDGSPLPQAIAWRGGFGDPTVYMPAEHVQLFASAAGKLQVFPYKKLGAPDQPAQRQRQNGPWDYAGIEDQYFATAFLPPPGTSGNLTLTEWRMDRDVMLDGKPAKEPIAELAVSSTSVPQPGETLTGPGAAKPLSLRVYVGPKDLDELKHLSPPLSDLVQFGWLEFIAAPLFYLLKWIHRYVPNYGWAIILMTLAINMVLFPLKVKSWRSMQKMQKVMPEVKAIQDRYKKYSMRDPRKQQMNQEVMAIYQREGINPVGGCLPMLLQMPIWFGLYRMLNVTIELRQAPWIGWIHDLSAADPLYILPVLMTVTMFVTQKMTPATSTDPTQQRMMQFMPLFFGILFFKTSSGLVLYILSSNLVGMAQQWYLNRTAPVSTQSSAKGNKKK